MLGNLEKAGLTAESATRAMVTSALLHPDAMFRTTPVAGDAARARRLAEHLSYALWDAPPDTELAAIGTGTASDLGARLRSQAERLGSDARAVPVLARFMAQWLHVDLDLKLSADAGYATSPLYLELLAFVQDALCERRSGDLLCKWHAWLRAPEQPHALRPDVGAGNGGRGRFANTISSGSGSGRNSCSFTVTLAGAPLSHRAIHAYTASRLSRL